MWQLIINGPGYFDTTYDLPEGLTQLGRADENDIVLSGDLVSRRHARLRVAGDELVFEDLGSRNGTRVNGQPLQGSVPLRPGDAQRDVVVDQLRPAEQGEDAVAGGELLAQGALVGAGGVGHECLRRCSPRRPAMAHRSGDRSADLIDN